MKPRILIVGTVPFKNNSPARALDSFFHFWPKEKLAQFFSNRDDPFKGHCSTLFRITDIELIKRRIKTQEVGTIFNYCDLQSENSQSLQPNKKSNFISLLYKIGKRRTPLTHLIRKIVWKKKLWLTSKFKTWIDSFNPECLFLSISDDFFIQEIGLYIANEYKIPIVCQIDDDYIFNRKFSLNPLYYIYKSMYEKQIDAVMSKKTSAVYICDGIKKAYNEKYHINGEVVYLASNVGRRAFKPIDKDNPSIVYFGSLRLDRYKTLIKIADALLRINDSYRINVYSDENDNKYIKPLKKCKNISFNGSIPYSEVIKMTEKSDLLLIVEGFSKFAIRSTRFSLSTKVADALCSGANLFACGTSYSGAMDYLKKNDYASVCTDPKNIISHLRFLFDDVPLQKHYYSQSAKASKNHSIQESSDKFETIIENLIHDGG